jgi:hypothetical protein
MMNHVFKNHGILMHDNLSFFKVLSECNKSYIFYYLNNKKCRVHSHHVYEVIFMVMIY